MINIYAPYGLGDVAIATSIIPFLYRETRENIRFHVMEHNASILEGIPCVDVIIRKPHDPELPEGTLYPTPWQNKQYLGLLPYAYIPQKAVLGKIHNNEPRPYLFVQPRHRQLIDEMKFEKPICLVETNAVSTREVFTDREIKDMATLLPNHELIIASKRKVEGFRDCSDIPLLALIPLYEKSDIFISLSSGISCITCASYKPPRRRLEVSRGEGISCIHMEPKTERFRMKIDLFNELSKPLG